VRGRGVHDGNAHCDRRTRRHLPIRRCAGEDGRPAIAVMFDADGVWYVDCPDTTCTGATSTKIADGDPNNAGQPAPDANERSLVASRRSGFG
jgi:hypothetical protein